MAIERLIHDPRTLVRGAACVVGVIALAGCGGTLPSDSQEGQAGGSTGATETLPPEASATETVELPSAAEIAASDPYRFEGNPFGSDGTKVENPSEAAQLSQLDVLTSDDLGTPDIYVSPQCDDCQSIVIVRYLDSPYGSFDIKHVAEPLDDDALVALTDSANCYECTDARVVTLDGGQTAAVQSQKGTVTVVTWAQSEALGVAVIGLYDDLTPDEALEIANHLSVQEAAAP